MEIETIPDHQPNEATIIQNDLVKYEDTYLMNNTQVCDMTTLVEIMSFILEGIISQTDKIIENAATVFHARCIPGIGVKDYLIRIVKHSRCSCESVILSLIYIDRMIQRNRGFLIKSINVHRVIITSVLLAAKFFDDFYYSNEYYAKIGGISNKEMNVLEVEFLNAINFSLHVEPEMFFRYREKMLAQRRN